MRFNALGPPVPQRSPIERVITLAFSANAITVATCIGVLISGFILSSLMDGSAMASLSDANKQLALAKIRHAQLIAEQDKLAELTSIAKGFGDVRKSGYSVAHALVAIGDAWPDPHVSQVSMKCQTPSEDGSLVTLTAISKNYEGSVGTIKALSRHGYFPIPNINNRKGANYEFSVEVRP